MLAKKADLHRLVLAWDDYLYRTSFVTRKFAVVTLEASIPYVPEHHFIADFTECRHGELCSYHVMSLQLRYMQLQENH